MLAALTIAAWALGLVLATGLCVAARTGDAQLHGAAEGREEAVSTCVPAAGARPEVGRRRVGGNAGAEVRQQADADLAVRSG